MDLNTNRFYFIFAFRIFKYEILRTDSQNAYIFYNTGIYNSITIQKAYLSFRYPKIWNTSIEKSYHIHTLQLTKDLEYILF